MLSIVIGTGYELVFGITWHTNEPLQLLKDLCFFLDSFFTDIMTLILEFQTLNEFHSDPLPVKISMSFQALLEENFTMPYNKPNCKSYRCYLTNTFNGQQSYATCISMIEEIDNCIKLFTTSLTDAVQRSVRKKFPDINFLGLPNHMLRLIRLRNLYRSQWSCYRQLYKQLSSII